MHARLDAHIDSYLRKGNVLCRGLQCPHLPPRSLPSAQYGQVTEPETETTNFTPRRIKVIDCLTRLLSRCREFPTDALPDLTLLKPLKKEMYDLYELDRSTGERAHSAYLQRLIELMIQVSVVKEDLGNETSPLLSGNLNVFL